MTTGAFYVRALTTPMEIDEDQGTADLLVVPYDTEAPVVELQPGRGRVAYTEVVRRGAAERALRGGAGRIPFTYGHSDDFSNHMGVARRFWDDASGLYASVRFDPSKLDAVRDAVTSSHQGVSMAFLSLVPKPFSEREGSLVVRRSIRLMHIAAVPFAAYEDARVLAVRNLADEADEVVTAAEAEVKAEAEAAEAVLREARELIESGNRWAAYRAQAG